jgi:hypothetical protein
MDMKMRRQKRNGALEVPHVILQNAIADLQPPNRDVRLLRLHLGLQG